MAGRWRNRRRSNATFRHGSERSARLRVVALSYGVARNGSDPPERADGQERNSRCRSTRSEGLSAQYARTEETRITWSTLRGWSAGGGIPKVEDRPSLAFALRPRGTTVRGPTDELEHAGEGKE